MTREEIIAKLLSGTAERDMDLDAKAKTFFRAIAAAALLLAGGPA